MADDSGIVVVAGVLAATGVIILAAKPDILTDLLSPKKGGGTGVGPGTTTPPPVPTPKAPPVTPSPRPQVFAPPGEWEDMPNIPLGAAPERGLYYNLPSPEQRQKELRRKNAPGLDIRIAPAATIYQGTYFKIMAMGFAPYEHVNFFFTARELVATGRYKFNTITVGGEIQHQIDKADANGLAEVKMLAPDTVSGPVDVVAVGVESGMQINTTMYILDTSRPRPIKRFRMNVAGEKFFVVATDPHVIRGLMDIYQGRQTLAHIHGKIGFGPGKSGFNRPWNWHIIPYTLTLSETDTTTCNVRPSTIQRDPAEYIRRNGFFCPLSARVEAIEYV
jgi:hypothetical protein